MTNTVIARHAALDWILNQLRQVSEGLPNGFSRVVNHDPQAIYDSRTVGVVYMGSTEPDGLPRMTLGNQMTALRFEILIYWMWGNLDEGTLDDYEREMVDVDRAVQAKLLADANADDNITALFIEDSDTAYVTKTMSDGQSTAVLRLLRIPVRLQELEAEAITI